MNKHTLSLRVYTCTRCLHFFAKTLRNTKIYKEYFYSISGYRLHVHDTPTHDTHTDTPPTYGI
jgi:hypothetical protein